MAANQKNQIRVSGLAKDLGMKNKEVIDLLASSGIEGKTHSTVLTPDEFSLVINALTENNQIDSLDDYIDGKIKIASAHTEKAQKPAAGKDSAEKAENVKAESAPTKADTVIEKAEAAPIEAASKPAEAKEAAPKETAAKPSAAKEPAKDSAPKAPSVKQDTPRNESSAQSRPQQQRAQSERPQFERRDNNGRPQMNRPQNDRRDMPYRDGSRPSQGHQAGERPNNQSQYGARPQGDRRDFGNRDNRDQNRSQNNNWNRPQNNGMGFKDKDKASNQGRSNSPKPAPVHTYTRGQNAPKNPGESRLVDVRTTTVDLEKYDERLENFVPESSKDVRGEKQKLKKQNSRDNQREKERLAMEKLRKQGIERAKKQPLQITVPDEISVGELASRLKMTAGEVIKKLMMLGVMATVNQIIDFDTAFLVAEELGAKVTKEVVVTIEEKLFDESEDSAEDLIARDPVVCVMGHVDHGKTSLLDAIRHTNVTSGEAGGITQAIGASRVRVNDRDITFLDTPGHEAFTAMRARGAKSTDIAILVVAADDGIMPQTVEAINHAKAAGIDIVVAINKMDKPTANPDNVKQELTKYELLPEEWGGDVICVPVSALTKMGIDDLLENVLLVADMKELKANPNRRAKGLILEAKLDKGRGPVATVLVQNGTLNSGDIVIAGTAVGRVRAMTDDKGRTVKTAGPSVPVEIIGLSEVPESGDEFAAVEDERMARELAEQRRAKIKEDQFKANAKVNLNDLFAQISDGIKDLNIIIKADVGGSAEAVKQSLVKLSNEEVRVNVIHTAVGGITEGDVMLAAASNAIVVGFNVRPDKSAMDKAEKESVEIRTYRIIYECIEEIEAAMKGMLAPTFKEVILGHAEVRQTIHVPNVGTIAGSYVQDGKVSRNAQIRVVRDGVVIFEDKISSLKRFKDDAREVAQGFECGIGLERFNDIKEGDILEAFMMEEVKPA